MSDFNPGDGWRQAAAESRGVEEGHDVLIRVFDGVRTYWVREETVPPLPTEPGFYRAEHPDFGGTVVIELLNRPEGQWVDAGDRRYLTDEEVRSIVPLVRLEERRETAKAVLDRVSHFYSVTEAVRVLSREFEVE